MHKNDFQSKYNAMSILILVVDVLLVFCLVEKKPAENQFHSSLKIKTVHINTKNVQNDESSKTSCVRIKSINGDVIDLDVKVL